MHHSHRLAACLITALVASSCDGNRRAHDSGTLDAGSDAAIADSGYTADPEAPVESCDVDDFAPVASEAAFEIVLKNASDDPRYVEGINWLSSADLDRFNLGGGVVGALALYTNQPSCAAILEGTEHCGQHWDDGGAVLTLAPGAEYRRPWDGTVWKRRLLPAECLDDRQACGCMQSVPAPAGAYTVTFDVSVKCLSGCECTPDDNVCLDYGELEGGDTMTADFEWPRDLEVVFELR